MSLGPVKLLKFAMHYTLLWQFDENIWFWNINSAYQVDIFWSGWTKKLRSHLAEYISPVYINGINGSPCAEFTQY